VSINSAAVAFPNPGTYAFGDYATPDVLNVLIFVTSEFATKCEGISQWPLTKENLIKMGIFADVVRPAPSGTSLPGKNSGSQATQGGDQSSDLLMD